MNIPIKVKDTIRKYKLCTPKGVPFVKGNINTKGKKEKILVALSGGKDSSVVAYLLKKFGYNIEGIYIDLRIGKYSDKCLEAVKKLCKDLDVKLHIYDIKKEQRKTMKEIWKKTKKMRLNNCVVCGIFKKWILNKEARKLKAEKIATGHNLDDEAQTFLMNIFKASPELSLKSGPITRNIRDKKFVPRVKPLFYIPEEDIKKYAKQKKLAFVEGKCPYAQNSYRIQVREFVNTLSDKEKENVIKNFEIVFKKLKKKKNTKINYCEICGEPSRNKICKMCELMKIK